MNVAGPVTANSLASGAVGNGEYLVSGAAAVPSTDSKRYSNLIGWSQDPMLTGGGTVMAAATVYLSKIPLAGSGTTTYSVTNVMVFLVTKGATLTHSYAGLLSSSGTLIGQSADQSTAGTLWGSTGTNSTLLSVPLVSGPLTVTPTGVDDFVYAALYVGTSTSTVPTFRGTAVAAALAIAGAASPASYRFATQAVADTTTPFTGLTLSNNVSTAIQNWTALT